MKFKFFNLLNDTFHDLEISHTTLRTEYIGNISILHGYNGTMITHDLEYVDVDRVGVE
jgi:hypothetical protein